MTPRHRPFGALGALALCTAALAGPGAPARAAEVRFTVQPAGTGAQRLELPPAFLSASARGDLADLRLRNAAGAEVPFLLVPPPAEPPRWADAVKVRAIPPTKVESGAELDLGGVREVAGLSVTFPQAGFLKQARVEGSVDGRHWTVLASGEALYALPLDPGACGGSVCPGDLSRHELRFEPVPARYLRLALDDRKSPRLGLPTAARALLAREGTAAAAGPLLPLEVAPREGEPGISRFALRAPGPHLPIRAIVLEVDAPPRLARKARVLEARLAEGRLAPVELGSGALLVAERDGVRVSQLRIPVSTPEEVELELVVEDGDNPALSLGGARAELAPLPWVYFETRDGAPLEARLGDPERSAPSYDLEALRPELARMRPARASAAGPLAVPPVPEPPPPAGDATAPGAKVDRGAFRFARRVGPVEPAGLVAVRLDADVLSRSPDLGDLRVVVADGRQLPYLLERRDEPLPVALQEQSPAADLPRELGRPGVTVHALSATQAAFPEARLVLETGTRVFAREVRVYVEPAPPGRRGPELLASASWAHADPSRAPPPLSIALGAFRARRLLVTVDDGDNAPLTLASARLLLPSYRLRFFHPGPALDLLYGGGLAAPRYDLALLAPRLRAAAAREVALGPPPSPGDETAGALGGARLAFWIALGVGVVGLLALVGRLLTRDGDAAT
jgi:hypothetical protein